MKAYFTFLLSFLFCFTFQAQVKAVTDSTSIKMHVHSVELWQAGQYDSAMDLANELVVLSRLNKDSLQLAKSLNTIGIIYSSKGDPVQSILYYEQSLEIFRLLRQQNQIATSLLNLGIAYKFQGNYEKALSNLIEAAEWFEQENNLKYMSSAYNTIGNIFRIQKRYDKALEYHNKALSSRREINYEKGIAGSLNNIGSVYMDLGNYDSALYYFDLSLKLKEIRDQPEEKATTLSQIAQIYYFKKEYARAESYYAEVQQLFESEQNKLGLAGLYSDLARLHYAQAAYLLAEKEAFQSLALAEETGASDIRLACYEQLKKIYTENKNYTKALSYAERFIVLNDSILGADKQKSLAQLEVKYESEKKQRELEVLNREKEKAEAIMLLQNLQLEAKTAYNNTLILTLVLLSIVVLLLLLLFRDRSLFAKKMDFLLRELHHRVKNNFQVLLSLFNLQLATVEDEPSKTRIEGNRNRITAMMLIHSGLYMDTDITRVRIKNYIQHLIDNLLVIYDLAPNGIQIDYAIDENLDIDVDKSISLGLLINELATNALKYACTPENRSPALRIEFIRVEERYHLTFADNGPGLDSPIASSSFGLKLAHAQAKQLKGTLTSTQEDGLKYEVTFE